MKTLILVHGKTGTRKPLISSMLSESKNSVEVEEVLDDGLGSLSYAKLDAYLEKFETVILNAKSIAQFDLLSTLKEIASFKKAVFIILKCERF